MARGASLGRLAEVSARQWGLVTARQARTEGVSAPDLHRLVGDEALEVVTRGVYFVRGGPHPDLLELRAAWLQLQPAVEVEQRNTVEGVVSHTSAALVHGLGDFLGDRHEFTLPSRRQTRRPDVILHRGDVGDGDVEWVDALPVTSVSRTIGDLLTRQHDGGHVARVALGALAKGTVSRAELVAVLARFALSFGLPAGDGEAVLDHLGALARSEQGIWS